MNNILEGLQGHQEKAGKISLDFVLDTLGLTIKKDTNSKLITFFAMLSAYTKESAFNVIFVAPSSTGKSYIPMQTASLFPKEDVLKYAYSSPTAFFHQTGQYDKEKNVNTINLEHKIIIFQDMPHMQLLERLRPMLSHDEKVLRIQITDKNQKGGNVTKQIDLIGYPAVVFCSANTHIDEQESTRFILLSPDFDQDKLKQGIAMKISREADPEKFQAELAKDENRKELIKRIKQVRNAGITEILIKPDDVQYIEQEYTKKRPELKPRHQRDIGRLIAIIKSFALLNYMFKTRVGNNIFADREDIDNAVKLWDEIAMSQELNLPPYIYDVYWEVIVPCYLEQQNNTNKAGITRNDITKMHLKVKRFALEASKLRMQIIPVLRDTGLINEVPDEKDQRIKRIIPTMLNKAQIYEQDSPINSEDDPGVTKDNIKLVEEMFNEMESVN